MAYAGVIARVRRVRPLVMKNGEEASSVNLATVLGYQVVLSKSVKEGALGIYFPPEGQLSREMCMANSLYRKHPDTGEPMGGYFGDSGRVRVQKFLGQESWGYWTPLDSLSWIDQFSPEDQKEGEEITEINGSLVCRKYFSPKARAAMQRAKGLGEKRIRFTVDSFEKHYDTGKLRIKGSSIPVGTVLYLTEKVHGTSGRAGNLLVSQPLSRPKRWWNSLSKIFGLPQYAADRYMYISGTRNVVHNPFLKPNKDVPLDFRGRVDEELSELGLFQGETLYFEIVGYKDPGSSIMGSHGVKDKALKKKYGSEMTYSYGCNRELGEHKIFVYRITQQGHNGDTIELSQQQIKRRCDTLGLETVPLIKGPFIYDGDLDALLELCEKESRGSSTLDEGHIREGVVIRIEGQHSTAMKYKSFWFCELEGIKKNDDNYVDPEEIS